MAQSYRLARIDAAPDTVQTARLADGLRLHLAHAPLDCIVMKIGARQQSYVGTSGCDGCTYERCTPGCRVEMLRRTLAQAAPALTMQLVRGSLATRPYTRAVLATPQPHAQALTAEHLAAWTEARLTISWLRTPRKQVRVATLLAVGADGPDPDTRLRAAGWQSWPLSERLGRLLFRLPIAGIAPRTLLPTILLPTVPPDADTVAPMKCAADIMTPEQDQALADWLCTVLASEHTTSAEHDQLSPASAPSIWPAGPHGLPPVALGTLIGQIIAEPSFQSTRRGQSGISKGRLVGLKHPALSEAIARTLMVWFDRAEVLEAPEGGQGPWRAPRPFRVTDLEQVAAHLRRTPLPTNAEVSAAYGGER